MAIGATAIWRIRPSGSNTNGGGYDPGISGAATDYSQQNAAQATGTLGTASGTTAFSDAGGAFTSAMVGNALWIASGSGFTAGAYFVTAFTSSTAVTLDRSPGTGTTAHWALGGGWATVDGNTTSSGPLVPGNTVFILGAGTPNPASYAADYTLAGLWTSVSGDQTNGNIVYANDPSTPGYKAPPDTTGGMPLIKANGTQGIVFNNVINVSCKGLWLLPGGATNGTLGMFRSGGSYSVLFGCILDQLGNDICAVQGTGNLQLIGCEVFSSASAGAGANAALASGNYQYHVLGCNIHDTIGPGILSGGGAASGQTVHVENSIIAKCHGNGIEVQSDGTTISVAVIQYCIIDGNTGSGIVFDTTAGISPARVVCNTISNHTGGGKFGLSIGAGATAANTRVAGFVDYNVYYNNTADLNAISYGPHDTHGGSNPYVGQSTENYTYA